MSIRLDVSSITCVACNATITSGWLKAPALEQLLVAGKRCARCGGIRFRATVTKTMSAMEEPDTDELLLGAALNAPAYGHTLAWQDVYEIPEMDGPDLIERLARPPVVVAEWITGLLKDAAKANLRPDQRLCSVCGEIYTIQLAGHTREGFCSPACKKKHARESR